MDHQQGDRCEAYSSDSGAARPEHSILDRSYPSSADIIKPPPGRRRVPRYRDRGGEHGCCLKCVCCCFCLWLLLILSLVGILVMLYSILQPRPPSFHIQHFQVNAFSVNPDSGAATTLSTEFILTLKSQNPNRGIGFFYGRGSSVYMLYNGTAVISSGKLPAFRQIAGSTSVMNVTLNGMSKFGSELQDSLARNEKAGRIPLLVMVKAPAAVVLRSFPLREIAFFVNGSLVVDSLSPVRNPRILSSQYVCSVGL